MVTADQAAAKAATDAPNGPTGAPTPSAAPVDLKGEALEAALSESKVSVPADATADEKRELLAASGFDPALKVAQRQYEEDNAKRVEDPNTVVVREANENFGGESFGYGS